MSTDVFLSYTAPDSAWAKTFAHSLRAQDLDVWFDVSDADLGASVEQSLLEALKTTSAVIIIVPSTSEVSSSSKRRLEDIIQVAKGTDIPLIPVAINHQRALNLTDYAGYKALILRSEDDVDLGALQIKEALPGSRDGAQDQVTDIGPISSVAGRILQSDISQAPKAAALVVDLYVRLIEEKALHGSLETAYLEMRDVVDYASRTFGSDHPSTILATSRLASLALTLGLNSEAFSLFAVSFDSAVRILGLDSPVTASIRRRRNAAAHAASMDLE